MSVIRVGSTGKYADGWDLVFGKSAGRKATAAKGSKKVSPTKKAAAARTKSAKAVKAKAATKRRKARRTRRG